MCVSATRTGDALTLESLHEPNGGMRNSPTLDLTQAASQQCVRSVHGRHNKQMSERSAEFCILANQHRASVSIGRAALGCPSRSRRPGLRSSRVLVHCEARGPDGLRVQLFILF